MVIRCTETSFRSQFSWFLKIVEEHPNGSKLTPGYPWWLPDITWMILDWFWDHQFFIIPITLVTRKRKASRKTSAPRHDTATKTYLYVCSNFDLLSFIDRRHHHRAHDTWRGHFAHVFWVSGQVTMGAPEGPSGGRRVLRTINNDETQWSIVRQHKKLCSDMVIWCAETSSRGQISWFLKIIKDHSHQSKITPGYLWWLLNITWMFLGQL